jgi:hypothetical protein
VDLAEVSADDAAKYLISLARSIGGTSGDEALSGAAMADAGDLSADFRTVVRDDNAPVSSRKSALFWLAQTDAQTQTLVDLYAGLDGRELRKHYTFVLSQRNDDDLAMKKLMDIARSDRDGEVRKQAMFWLGQSKDPAVTKFFKDILTP